MTLPAREAATAFADVVYADQQWVDAEFDALISASFSEPPTPPPPPAPPRVPPPPGIPPPPSRPSRPPVPVPADAPSPATGPEPGRQRSPPAHPLTQPPGH